MGICGSQNSRCKGPGVEMSSVFRGKTVEDGASGVGGGQNPPVVVRGVGVFEEPRVDVKGWELGRAGI